MTKPQKDLNVRKLSQEEISEGLEKIFKLGIYGYTGQEFSLQNPSSSLLRIQFNFGLPLPGYSTFTDRRSQQNEKVNKFLVSFLSFFRNYNKLETDSYRIFYGGKEISTI